MRKLSTVAIALVFAIIVNVHSGFLQKIGEKIADRYGDAIITWAHETLDKRLDQPATCRPNG